MNKSKFTAMLMAAALVVSFSLATTATAQLMIFPGVDLFETPNDSMTVDSQFTVTPLPADFFGPGSDPFDGIIALQGSPLATLPPDTLGPTDVIIQRLEPALLGGPGSADTILLSI